jgi:mRNA-degrading endonuclease RelE of RelBE toxin-antitoxin system
MTNKPSVTVGYAPQFKRDLKQLRKKYRNIQQDIEPLIKQIQSGETPGDRIRGASRTVYKVRLRSTNLNRGKRGGLRLVYYIRTPERIVFVTIYSKSEQADITPDEIRRLIDEID